ncbi:IclR family transcriptional regulator [Salinicola corii]|uniref:HTH-type transcriptional repressor AllR n=1 Tax=Salinicola corii TaxID=2606937 RepID=A0A640WEN5_9GAMM|nr:IclR family transcriptional regulator [Salinicola corii]KAA0018619.1 IclR family transcriptional regulator [Salinicola corii]
MKAPKEPAGPTQGSAMPSVDKALRALLTLADAGPAGLSLNELSSALNLNKSSLHVTLSALKFRGFITQRSDTGFYGLGSSIHTLYQSYINNLDIIGILRPAVRQLSVALNEVCHISILDDKEILYLERIESRKPIQAGTSVGMRIPATNTAMGRIMLAHRYRAFSELEAKFGEGYRQPCANAPASIEGVWERVREARQAGYGLDMEENVPGVVAISIAVLDHSGPVAAVSVATLANEITREALLAYEPSLRSALADVVPSPYWLSRPEDTPRGP